MSIVNKVKSKWNSIPITVKASTSYAVCSILQKSISLVTLPLFTRILTTEQYGQYTIYTSWSNILMIFITLNLAYGSFSTAMVKFEKNRNQYISSLQGIFLLLTGIFCAIYFPFRHGWNVLFDLPTGLMVVMLFEMVLHTSFSLWCGKNRFEYKYKAVVIVTLLNTVAAPALAFLFVMNSDEKGYARILGYALVAIIIGAFFFIYNFVKGKMIFSKEYWKYAFGFNIPLLAYYLSQVVFNQSDRIMINHLVGKDKAAMYGVAYNLAMILNFILNAINGSYVPWYYGKLKEGRQNENKPVACGIAILMGLMLLCVIWFAPEIILVLAGREYAEAVGVVPPVAMSLMLLFYSQLFINVQFYFEQKKSLVFASIGSAIVNIVLNALLIPVCGFVAAGYTTLVSYVIFAIANYGAMKKTLAKNNIDEAGYDMKILIMIIIVFVVSGFLGMFLYDFLILRIIITGIVFLIFLKFKDKLLAYIKEFKK